jgi:hypothetical protein
MTPWETARPLFDDLPDKVVRNLERLNVYRHVDQQAAKSRGLIKGLTSERPGFLSLVTRARRSCVNSRRPGWLAVGVRGNG